MPTIMTTPPALRAVGRDGAGRREARRDRDDARSPRPDTQPEAQSGAARGRAIESAVADRPTQYMLARLARLEAARPDLAAQAVLLAAQGPGAERLRLNGDLLDAVTLEPASGSALAALAGLFGARSEETLHVGAGAGSVALAPEALTVARIGRALARSAAEAEVARVGFGVSVRFAAGPRLLLTGPEDATITLAFADETTIAIAPGALRGPARIDLRL
jgi:hypothetical protein